MGPRFVAFVDPVDWSLPWSPALAALRFGCDSESGPPWRVELEESESPPPRPMCPCPMPCRKNVPDPDGEGRADILDRDWPERCPRAGELDGLCRLLVMGPTEGETALRLRWLL